MINKLTSNTTKINLSKAFGLAAFVLFEAPIALILLGNMHNIPFFNFFMSGAYSGAFTDTGYSFYTPPDLLNAFHSGSMHFYLIIPILIVAKVIHSRYGKEIDAFLRRFS
ncbi:hypothetical protein LZ898_004610 [Salmonella enterica]|nr:hypothetical protein [Salmonella enterica]